MNIKIGSIVIRCYEFDKMLEFWQAALGYKPLYPVVDNSWVILGDPEKKDRIYRSTGFW